MPAAVLAVIVELNCAACTRPPQAADLVRIANGEVGIGWDSIKPHVALGRLHRLKEPALLARVAKEGKLADIRRDAILSLSDQPTLIGLATAFHNDEDDALRGAVVARLTDQAALTTMLLSEYRSDSAVFESGKAAMRRITDEALLAGLADGNTAYEIRRLAIFALTDRAVLERIAAGRNDQGFNDHADFARRRLEDLAFFQRVGVPLGARSAEAACDALDDAGALATVAVHDPHPEHRLHAIARVRDRAVLLRIANGDKDRAVRVAASAALGDHPFVATVALRDPEPLNRKAAVEQLKDQPSLVKIARTDEYYWVRAAAVRRITDEAVLADIARKDGYDEPRLAAIAGLITREALRVLVETSESDSLRNTAFLNCLALSESADAAPCGVDRAQPADQAWRRWADHKVSAVSAIRRALSAPVVTRTHPRLRLRFEWRSTEAGYSSSGFGEATRQLTGERVDVRVSLPDGRVVAEASWASQFEKRISQAERDMVLADSDVLDIVRQVLLDGRPLNPGEVEQYLGAGAWGRDRVGQVPEDVGVPWIIAAANLVSDEPTLIHLMLEHDLAGVREAAARRLLVAQPGR
jgi:hypothetical protein